MPGRKGQMFVITMIFLVAMIFSVQGLLLNYLHVDLSLPSQSPDTYIMDNIESVFQSAVRSSDDCATARNNVIVLKEAIGRSMKEGREIVVKGDIGCTIDGEWPEPPELTVHAVITREGSETLATFELSR
jgi:hypothetical protein